MFPGDKDFLFEGHGYRFYLLEAHALGGKRYLPG